MLASEIINYLQENVYSLLRKAAEAKRLLIEEGNRDPTKEEIAERVGITVEKLQRLLQYSRMPLSMQRVVWQSHDTTFQVYNFLHVVQMPSQMEFQHPQTT